MRKCARFTSSLKSICSAEQHTSRGPRDVLTAIGAAAAGRGDESDEGVSWNLCDVGLPGFVSRAALDAGDSLVWLTRSKATFRNSRDSA